MTIYIFIFSEVENLIILLVLQMVSFIFSFYCKKNIREYRKGNKKWTIQKKLATQGTSSRRKTKQKHNTIIYTETYTMFSVTVMFCYVFHIKPHIFFKILFQKQFLFNFDVRGCAGGRIGTRFLRPRGTSPLKGVNPAGTPGYRNGTESFFGLKGRPSVVRDA